MHKPWLWDQNKPNAIKMGSVHGNRGLVGMTCMARSWKPEWGKEAMKKVQKDTRIEKMRLGRLSSLLET